MDQLFRQELAHHRLLFLQLVHGRLYFSATEFVNWQARHDLQLLAVAAEREGTDQSLFDAVAAVGTDRKSTRELQSQSNLVCRLLLEKKKKKNILLAQKIYR